MKYEQLCQGIIAGVGGADNIDNVTHCVTRLRFKLRDESRVDKDALSALDGVLTVIQTGGQCQVVVGTAVNEVFDELCTIAGLTDKGENPVAVATSTDSTGAVASDAAAGTAAAASGIGTPDANGATGEQGTREKPTGGFAERFRRHGGKDAGKKEGKKKVGPISRFLIVMTGIFNPLLGMLMAMGMVKALLVLLTTVCHVIDTNSGTYIVLYAIGDAMFYFFPILVGWTAAKQFGLKEVYGLVIGAILTYPTITALSTGDALFTVFSGSIFESQVYTSFLGIPVILPSAGYTNSVIPAIVVVWVASYIYKFLQKHLPPMMRTFFTPFLTLIIAVPLGFLVFGPLAIVVQGILTSIIKFVIGINSGLAGFLIGGLWTLLVMFGLHMPVIMMFQLDIVAQGFDKINPLIFAGALSNMGACLGVFLRTKDPKERAIALPAMLSAFFGISEPTLYGVLVPRKKLFISTLVCSGIGGAIAGFGGATLWNMSTSGPLGLPGFISPNGIDSGFVALCIGAVVAFVAAAVCGFIFGGQKEDSAIEFKGLD
ncbi:PTS transporter subunit EIIC [Bifidobacterium choloepi]|uniref:PTS beta-glucoside transporter subunit EIIBCA n=1 Tax=Bifidobacterium choloepi TaxID=2614131 RepID=A0A6I5MYS8_9BIFI|nr:PTS transporter subunit EIIC [Bifidobacterium choloepi]NEG69356.1 PTS beta-glucoside transporter subunit EIIBCA [Bifidobacterium choloepi]